MNFEIPYALIAVVMLAIVVASTVAWLLSRYKRCPSDRILVIYGRTGRNKEGNFSSAKCIHGGGAFVWPVIQDYAFLELRPLSISIDLRNALTKQNIRVSVPSRFTIAISTDPANMNNAAERLLGLTRDDIDDLARDILFGQLRMVIASMSIEEINADRDKFLDSVNSNVQQELTKVGLRLINVNITDITDESGYIDALGQKAAATAINEAKVQVSEQEKDGNIGVANARQQQDIQVALAEKTTRIETAAANAEAVDGENRAKASIAASQSELRVKEAEANRAAAAAMKVKEAEAQKESYAAQRAAEEARAEREKAFRYANEVVPAEIAKQTQVIQAQAEAEKIRELAQGQADAKFLQMEAEARGIQEILDKQAAGFKGIVEAAGGNAEHAFQLLLLDKLPELTRIQVEAIKAIKIDKVVVWDNAVGTERGSSTANFLSGIASSLPPLTDLMRNAGMSIPRNLVEQPKEKEDKSDQQRVGSDN